MAIDTVLAGSYRLVHRDSNDNVIAELLEKHNTELGGVITTGHLVAETDAQKMAKVKKALSTILREDDKLVVMFRPSVTDTENATAVGDTPVFRIPVTFKNRRSGVVYEKTLVYSDFTELRRAGNVNALVWTKDTMYDLAYYLIPAQSEMKLGHSIQDVRVDSAITLAESYTT